MFYIAKLEVWKTAVHVSVHILWMKLIKALSELHQLIL